jgi:hypothetical protein
MCNNCHLPSTYVRVWCGYEDLSKREMQLKWLTADG